MIDTDRLKALDDAPESFPGFILAVCFHEDLEVVDGPVGAYLVLIEESADVLPDKAQCLLALVNGMAEHVVAVSYEDKAYDSVIDAGLSLLQDLFALHCEPEPVAVAGDIIS